MNTDSILNWLVPAAIASAACFAAALAIVFLLRRGSAAIRHFVLASAFLGSALFSVALLVPNWNWPALEASAAEPTRLVSLPFINTSGGITIISPQTSAPIPVPPAETGLGRRGIIVLIWLGGSVLGLARLAAGLVALRRISQTSSECASVENRTSAILRTSLKIDVPLTWGWLRPVILLPANFPEWTAEHQRLALLHESAHVRRGDWPVLMLAQIVRTLFWFDPLAWLALRKLQAEQEKAADDLVLSDSPATSYANALLDFARRLQLSPQRLPAVPILRGGSLEDRVRSLMNPRVSRRRPGFTHVMAISIVLGLLCLVPIVKLTAREPAAKTPTRRLTEVEQRFVGQWQGGGMFPSNFHFKEDGTYEARPFDATNVTRGIWSIDRDLLTYATTDPTNLPAKTRRILQVSSNFFQWQFVGEESKNIFGYHRLNKVELGTIAGFVLRNGKPLLGTDVLLEPFTPEGQPLPRTESKTDNEGRFAFHGLTPGLYKISRSISWNAITDQGSSQTTTWTHAQVVHLEKDKTIELTLGKGRTVRGEFVPPAGLKKEQLAFTAGDYRFLTPVQRRVDGIPIVYVLEIKQDGTLTSPDLPPGQYNLYATVRKMNGPLDGDHIASASAQITVLDGPGDQEIGKVQLTAMER